MLMEKVKQKVKDWHLEIKMQKLMLKGINWHLEIKMHWLMLKDLRMHSLKHLEKVRHLVIMMQKQMLMG